MTRYIYEFSGRFSLHVYKHKILKEMPKTFQIQKTNWPYRLFKKNIGVKEWDGGFYSFDLQEVLVAAYEGIEAEKKSLNEKVEKCLQEIELVKS